MVRRIRRATDKLALSRESGRQVTGGLKRSPIPTPEILTVATSVLRTEIVLNLDSERECRAATAPQDVT